jgi:hypothetical protein
MAEGTSIRAYVVGDELRLVIEVVCLANVETVMAMFRHEDTDGTITLHGDATLVGVEESPLDDKRWVLHKTYRAELVSIVDVDHTLGGYHLELIELTTAASSMGGTPITISPGEYEGFKEGSVRFAVTGEVYGAESVTARLTDPPDLEEEQPADSPGPLP